MTNLIEQLGGAKARFKSRKLVAGVGFNTLDMPTKINNKHTPEYVTWREMLRRCYSDNFQKKCPNYIGCSVCEEWHDFKNFYNDLIKMDGYNKIGLGRVVNLDKDLLHKGNKIYSKSNCCILPQQLNKLITTRGSSRGDFPIGVHYSEVKRKFVVQLSLSGKKNMHIGYFYDKESAFSAYKKAKESRIKELASYFRNQISIDAYNALFSYEVSIND